VRTQRWLYTIPLRIRSLFKRRAADADLDEELQFHLDQKTQEFISKGLSEKDARYAALREFRGVEQSKENCRDTRKVNLLLDLAQDLRFGLRMLRKNPGFTIIAVLTLALGIGAATIVFTVINATLLRPIPFSNPDQLVQIFAKTKPTDEYPVGYSTFLFWQRNSHAIPAMAAWTVESFDLTGAGEAERIGGKHVSANFFSVFGVKPVLGRTFLEADDHLGAAPVVLVSEGLWKRRFGASSKVIGQVLTLNQADYEIVGVIPASFRLWSVTDVYIPAGQSENPSPNYRGPGQLFAVTGRLGSGVTHAQAQADMNIVFRDFAAAYPTSVYEALGISVHSLKQDIVGNLQPTLLLLLGAVGFVLLIACANIANLTLARSVGRAREFAVRAALGADRRRLIRQLLTETLLFYSIGATLGVWLAGWGTHLVLRLFPSIIPEMLRVSLDYRVLSFALAASAFTGIFFGLVPALKSSTPNLQNSLKETSHGIATRRHLTQSIFVVAEISLALVLLVGAGLMIRTMQSIGKVNPGFDPHNVMAFLVSMPQQTKFDPDVMRDQHRELIASISAIPGVEWISWGYLPMASDGWTPYWPEDRPQPKSTSGMNSATFFPAGPDYFRVMSIPLQRGRVFTSRDNHSAPRVIVVDENLARHAFSGEDPLGKRLNMAAFGSAEIVGVVGHVKEFGLVGDSQAKIQDQIYQPFEQLTDKIAPVIAAVSQIVIRTSVKPAGLLDTIRDTVAKTDNRRAVYGVRLMEEVLADSQRQRRFETILLGAFAAIAMLLASIGIYGVISHLTAQRTHEIGIRVALGAQRWHIIRIVVSQAGGMALAGIALGIAASVGLTRLIANWLFGVSSTDPATFISVSGAVLFFTVAASYIPARRATRVDPMVALRNE
jgi:predicted permease